MAYYKIIEIAKKHHISQKTVYEWINNALINKNNLQVEKNTQGVKILITHNNEIELERLAKDGKKFNNNKKTKKIQVEQDFYDLFSQEEIVEIINDLQFKKEIKHKFMYKKAQHWNSFYLQNGPITTNKVAELIQNAFVQIAYYTQNSKINIVDIGQGNAIPSRQLIDYFDDQKLLQKYIAVDISEEMNILAQKNIQTWYPNLQTKFYQKDIENDRLGQVFLENKKSENLKNYVNLVFFIGGTMSSLHDRIRSLKNIGSLLSIEDLFIFNFTLDTPKTRSELNYVKDPEGTERDGWLLRLLGVEIDNLESEVRYNSILNCKEKCFVMDQNYEIKFKIGSFETQVFLQKGDRISTWKYFLLSSENVLKEIQESGLRILSMSVDKTNSFGLVVCSLDY